MTTNFPTSLDVVALLKDRVNEKRDSAWSIADHGPVMSEHFRNLNMYHFDVTLADGRVYRVRVSDITPEKEPAT